MSTRVLLTPVVGAMMSGERFMGPVDRPHRSRSGGVDTEARDHLALALDTDDLVVAMRLARLLSGYFSHAKVGLELYAAAGSEAIAAMLEIGYVVFCDLKLHDIPTTVSRCARVLGELGVTFLTVHAAGGPEMLKAGVAGLGEGSNGSAQVLAVTVLTSDPARDETADMVARRIELASATGCGGVVCAAPDLVSTREIAPELLRVVPGIRLPGDATDDQRRVSAPQQALAAGADLLVVGRSVTASPDPLAAAERLHQNLHKGSKQK